MTPRRKQRVEFTLFLEILGDMGNYDDNDPYRDAMAKKIDKLMGADGFKEWN